jgi:hypothetical protein
LDRALRYGMRRGFDLGLLEGSRGWVVIGGAALLAHLAGRAMSRRPETVFFERLQPGDAIQIVHDTHS